MEREFVPYMLAVKLKELGFDEPCFGYYHVCDGYTKGYAFCYFNEPERYESDSAVLAPTFSQTFRFFREKYGVHGSPTKYSETQWWVEWGSWTSPVFETFEEAELAWLEKLIEIVETKSE